MLKRFCVLAFAIALTACHDGSSSDNTVPQVSSDQNAAPTIVGTPPTTAVVGAAYVFQPAASDANGDKLSFSIKGQPQWASFDPTTGKLSGAPGASQTGIVSGIVIGVTDGVSSAALPPFKITVNAKGNVAPTISGKPAVSVVVGASYAFQPVAGDGNGDSLTFSIQNKPLWASFDTASGRLSGTPGTANVGNFPNITIAVSDGNSSTNLAPFAVMVMDSASGAATLSWTPPTTNTDGSALTNLAGYRIYYGTTSSDLTQTVEIANPGLASYVISNLSAATWFFSVKALTSANVESEFSNLVSKTIQ